MTRRKGPAQRHPTAFALAAREAGFVRLPALYVRREDMKHIEGIALRYQREINDLRAECGRTEEGR